MFNKILTMREKDIRRQFANPTARDGIALAMRSQRLSVRVYGAAEGGNQRRNPAGKPDFNHEFAQLRIARGSGKMTREEFTGRWAELREAQERHYGS